jgi:ABC-2 type transport system ATP-binding protein
MAAIEVDNLVKSYGANRAVDGVSFRVPEGIVFALLGPNGAGKTTTIEILEGYRDADSGHVSVLDMDPGRGGPALRDRIGIVLQESGIDPVLTVAETLDLYGSYYSRRRPTAELIELTGLGEKRDERVRTLSGGQRRRLDLALALVGDPDLIFLDEPTTGFDPSARRRAWELVADLTSLGKTILLTTHYLDEAQQLADHIAVMGRGRIIAEGPPDALADAAPVTTITFELPEGVTIADLPAMSGAPKVAGSAISVETSNPTRDVHALTGWAIGRGSDLNGLTVSRPNLEDVYLEIIGEAGADGEPPTQGPR